MDLVLASASARRVELLKRITENFEVKVSNFDENSIQFRGDVPEYVIKIAKGKAEACAKTITIDENKDTLVIGCDTVVVIGNNILGKPGSREEAFDMLKLLSGKVHKVFSGIAILDIKSGFVNTDFSCTEVKFSNISDEMIEKYVESGDCMDKAGSYGIQGAAAVFVEGINGCFYNVVGLPINKLHKMLREMGVNL